MRATQVADDHASRSGSQVIDRGGAVTRARVQHELMSLIDERSSRSTPKAIRAAGDEDPSHGQPRGSTRTVADRARAPIIGFKYGLPAYFAR